MTTSLLVLLVLLPATAGTLLAAGGVVALSVVERWAGAVALAVSAVTLLLAVTVAVTRPSAAVPFLLGLPAGVAVDGLSAAMVVTVAVVTVLVLMYAAAEQNAERTAGVRQSRGRFFGLMLVFAAAMQLTVVASSLPALLIGWELMGATSYALIGFRWRDPHRAASGLTAFLTTRAADLGLFVAAGAAVAGSSSTARGALTSLAHLEPGWRDVAAAGIVVAAAGKSAQLPFSFWLSRAMDGPSPVSALLHSATMVAAGGYLVLRVSPVLDATGWAAPTVAWLGAVTAVVMGVVAVAQRDLKQVLAASTCAQVGFMFLAAGSGAVAGGALQLVAHAATKALLFGVAGVWLSALGTRSLSALTGVARRWRPAGILFAVGSLGLAGLPPFALWTAKDAALANAAATDVPLYVAGLIGAALSAVYSTRVLVTVWAPSFMRSRSGNDLETTPDTDAAFDTEQPGTRRVTTAMLAPLAVLAVGAVVLVVLGVPPLVDIVGRDLFPGAGGDGPTATAGAAALLVSAVVAVTAAAATAFAARRGVRLRVPGALRAVALRWWGLERAAHVVVVVPTLALARALDTFDRGCDRLTERTAGGTLSLAALTRRVGEAGVDRAVDAVATASRALGRLARRPQTGQLHQYYAQALVAVAVIAVVLLLVR